MVHCRHILAPTAPALASGHHQLCWQGALCVATSIPHSMGQGLSQPFWSWSMTTSYTSSACNGVTASGFTLDTQTLSTNPKYWPAFSWPGKVSTTLRTGSLTYTMSSLWTQHPLQHPVVLCRRPRLACPLTKHPPFTWCLAPLCCPSGPPPSPCPPLSSWQQPLQPSCPSQPPPPSPATAAAPCCR